MRKLLRNFSYVPMTVEGQLTAQSIVACPHRAAIHRCLVLQSINEIFKSPSFSNSLPKAPSVKSEAIEHPIHQPTSSACSLGGLEEYRRNK